MDKSALPTWHHRYEPADKYVAANDNERGQYIGLTRDQPAENRAGSFMQTYTGRQYWPMSPRPHEVYIEDIAHSLSLQCRYAGHCIDDTTFPEQYLGIRAGEVYTATWVGMCRTYLGGDYAGIRLAGVNRGVCPQFGDEDPPFALRRFKPVVKPRVEHEKKIEETA